MAKENKKELLIIGAGPGGYAAAFRAADLGLQATIIDPEVNPGGVCLYRGCIPSKALLHVAEIKHKAAKAADRGLKFKEPGIDIEKINHWKNSVVKKLTSGLGQLIRSRNIEYIQGRAKFISAKQLEVEKEGGEKIQLEFGNVVIATGSKPQSLPNIETDHQRILDSKDALDLKEIPGSMLIIGGGYIGLELGSVYAALGCKVSIAEMTSGFLPGTDRDLVEVFEKENAGLFDKVYFNTRVEKITSEKEKVQVVLKNKEGTKEEQYEKVLIATGRQPETGFLNLKKAGVKTDEGGFVKVNLQRQTSTPHIFAIGDLTGEPLLANKAAYEGKIVAEVIAGEAGAAYDPRAIPGIVFTNPEIAWCGLTEAVAKEENIKIKTVKYPWAASGYAAMTGAEQGVTKLLFNAENGIILGGGVAGKNAGALIPEISFAIEMGATAEELSACIHPHPGFSETIMEAAELFFGSATHVVSEKEK